MFPQVPDSPDTLYKLLKVSTRKNYRRGSSANANQGGGSSRTSGVVKPKKNASTSKKGCVEHESFSLFFSLLFSPFFRRFAPSGGSWKGRRVVRHRAGGSRGSSSTPGSRAMSEEMESANSTDQSDDEDSYSSVRVCN